MTRVAVYIDGHNVHSCIKRWQAHAHECLKWLDYWKFCRKVVSDAALGIASPKILVAVNSYTALPVDDQARKARHEMFIKAVEECAAAAGGVVRTVKGFYRVVRDGESCTHCGHTWPSRKEKQSDTALCVELLDDAYQDAYDCAVVLTQDSDMAPAMAMVIKRFPNKRVVTAYPPLTGRNTRNHHLEIASHTSIRTTGIIRACQMPDPVVCADNTQLHCPEVWVLP